MIIIKTKIILTHALVILTDFYNPV